MTKALVKDADVALSISETIGIPEAQADWLLTCLKTQFPSYFALSPSDNGVGALDTYDAGLLNDYGGGNVDWWQDYIRAELARAHDFYQSQVSAQGSDNGLSGLPQGGPVWSDWIEHNGGPNPIPWAMSPDYKLRFDDATEERGSGPSTEWD